MCVCVLCPSVEPTLSGGTRNEKKLHPHMMNMCNIYYIIYIITTFLRYCGKNTSNIHSCPVSVNIRSKQLRSCCSRVATTNSWAPWQRFWEDTRIPKKDIKIFSRNWCDTHVKQEIQAPQILKYQNAELSLPGFELMNLRHSHTV